MLDLTIGKAGSWKILGTEVYCALFTRKITTKVALKYFFFFLHFLLLLFMNLLYVFVHRFYVSS